MPLLRRVSEDTKNMRHFRVFLSSPGDVSEERLRAHEILQIMPQEPAWRGRISVEVVRWDNPYSPTPIFAHLTPQEAVNQNLPKPSECDLVVIILWSRFGTPLLQPLKPDGSPYLSGTEWEYEDAVSAKVPTLVYRRMSEPQVSLRDPEIVEKKHQLELVEKFFARFTEPGGAAIGGYIPYSDTTEFREKFRRVIEGTIRQVLDSDSSSSPKVVTPPEYLAIVDELSRQLEEKDRQIADLQQTLVLKTSTPLPQREELRPPGTPTLAIEVANLDRVEISALPRDPSVVAVAPVIPMKLIDPLESPDVPADVSTTAWGVAAVGADTSPYNGRGITAAIIDTGIDANHPAFSGVSIVERDFTGEGNGDRHGHGTHFAGTFFGRPVDGIRIGVAPGIEEVLIAKAVGSRGATSEALLNAITWALHEGANVITMSLRFDLLTLQRHFRDLSPTPLADDSRALQAFHSNSKVFQTLFDFARNQRSLIGGSIALVAAAGNESQRDMNPNATSSVSSPADEVISVAAIGRRHKISPFSNTGASIVAPGEQILSARAGGGLTLLSGTSMATAHVAGIAALWAQKLAANKGYGENLSARVLGSASSEAMAPGYDPFDVGAGIARAPQ